MKEIVNYALPHLQGEFGGILALFGILGAVGGFFLAQKLIISESSDRIRHLKAHIEELEKSREDATSFTNILPNMHMVYTHLNEVMVRLGGSRCMVMYTENGGGMPNIGSQLYVSVVYEVFTSLCGSIRNMMQRKLVDEAYVTMLGYMITNPGQRTIVVTELMPPCMLRDIYEKSGVKMSLVYLIKQTDARLYYASFNFPHTDNNPQLIYECDIKANQIAQLFTDME